MRNKDLKNMKYPLISEYIDSIMSAEDNFATLIYLRPVFDNEGRPVMSSGNFSVIFKMEDVRDQKLYAIKCFTKEQNGRDSAYKKISKEINDLRSSYFLHVEFLEKELFVDSINTIDDEFPVVLMDWVEGLTLDKYVQTNIDNTYCLKMLAYNFSRLGSYLLSQNFAHGDLKPDNIIIGNSGKLFLVDYDGMYFPAMKGMPARELGSPDYQHPERNLNDFNELLDDFSIVLITLSLKVIALKPELYKTHTCKDALLFKRNDFLNIHKCYLSNSISELLHDNSVSVLWGLFLVALANGNLLGINHRLLNIAKPEDEELDNQYIWKMYHDCKKDGNIEELSELCKRNIASGNNLGVCYLGLSYCVEHDYPELKNKDLENKENEFLEKAIAYENPKAMCILATRYITGWFEDRKPTEAFRLFNKAYNMDYLVAYAGLANCYYNGLGTTRDFSKTLELVKSGAEKGERTCQFWFGHWYDCGAFQENGYVYNLNHKDKSKAEYWYKKAAIQNVGQACYRLSYLYFYNDSLSNLILAQYWMNRANSISNGITYGGSITDNFNEDSMQVLNERNLNQSEMNSIDYVEIVDTQDGKVLKFSLKGLVGNVSIRLIKQNLYYPENNKVALNEIILVSYKRYDGENNIKHPSHYKTKLCPFF